MSISRAARKEYRRLRCRVATCSRRSPFAKYKVVMHGIVPSQRNGRVQDADQNVTGSRAQQGAREWHVDEILCCVIQGSRRRPQIRSRGDENGTAPPFVGVRSAP